MFKILTPPLSCTQVFDRKSSLILVLLCLPLLFFPKINLIKLSQGETAGLRIDDLILFFFSIVLLWAHFSMRNFFFKIELWVFALVCFSFFSYFSNKILVLIEVLPVNSKIFYCVRIFEYFLFFYVGAMASQFFRENRIIKAFFIWNLSLMLLQKAGVIGEFNSMSGYNAEGAYRVSGIASFPSEMGALLNLMFCYFLFEPPQNAKSSSLLPSLLKRIIQRTYIYWLFFLFAVLVILTGSRIALVALILPFFVKLKEEFRSRNIESVFAAMFFLLFATAILFFFIANTESIATRSQGLLSWRNLDLVKNVWQVQDITLGSDDVNEISYEGYDLSWWIRIHKWCYALKMYVSHPENYLQGIGPGFAWLALDGGLLRILVEYGLLGCVIFWRLFRSISQQNVQLKWMVVALVINMIFFDSYLAYKPMSLLFFVAGYAHSQGAQTRDNCKSLMQR